MRLKSLVCTLALLITCTRFSFADTFIVTSSADSGPGTLREALTLANANGANGTDYIHFNIPQAVYNLRIIELVNELPALSSNIIIDGTTQPGAAYGTTDAKICVRKLTYAAGFSMLKIENARNVQVYGLHLYYGYWQGFFSNPLRSNMLYGVNIVNASDIIIGAPGRGNVITGVVHGIYSNSAGCSNITIRANYLGHGAFYSNPTDDIDNVILSSDCCITLANVKDIFIGGPQAAQGNIFGGSRRCISIDSKNITGNGLAKVQHNIFARAYDKIAIITTYDFWDRYINIGRSRNNPVDWTLSTSADYRVELLDNDIPNDAMIRNISDSLIVMRNQFVYDYRTHGGKLVLSRTGPGLIGGDNLANANFFLNKKPGNTTAALYLDEAGAVTILKNIFDCNASYGSTIDIYNTSNRVPFAQIDLSNPNSVTGRSTPNARIDLYYDDGCSACEGEVYLTTVQADNNGNWTYAGTITGTVIATATRNGYTSMFSFPTFNHAARKIVQPVCGLKNGSITGITTEGAETFFWVNLRTGDTVSRALDLVNAGPGEYVLYGVHGGTCVKPINQSISLDDVTPVISYPPSSINQPTCGLSNGSILNMRVYNTQNSKQEWKNELGQVVGTQADVYRLPPGKYTFYATDTTVGCTAVSPTYELINQGGASLNTGALQITPTTCGNANGSITGLTATNITGTPFLQWVDALNRAVGTTYDLVNVPAGTYRFKFKDQGSCDTIIRPFTIGALNTFSPITVTSFTAQDGLCNQPTASISIQTFSVDPANYTFRWVNAASGTTVGNGIVINNQPGGTYQLFAMDQNNCESNIFSATVTVKPKPTFDYTGVTVYNDECNQQMGEVASLKVNGLVSPTTYAWFNQNGTPVGGNTAALQQVPAGIYYLQVTDAGNCIVQSNTFTISNTDVVLPAPFYPEIVIPRHSDATLAVRNPSAGDYTLYADAAAATILQQNKTGIFNLPAVPADVVLYVQQQRGICASALAPAVIRVVDKSFFAIPNAFTPNRDGKNDQLTVRIKGYIKLNYFRIYNRWGQTLFETKKVNDVWDGTWKGMLQPAGTYVWMAEGKDLNGNIIRDRGSIVLIR